MNENKNLGIEKSWQKPAEKPIIHFQKIKEFTGIVDTEKNVYVISLNEVK